MTEELATYNSENQSCQHLIALALERQADPIVLSKLMDLQERWEAQKSRKAYVIAMSEFKQEAPAVLKKGDRVDFTTQKGRTAYNYANLGSIVQEITATLGKHELSATWQTSQDSNGNITVTCNITHAEGHRESVTLTGPPDDSGNKNKIQAIGSAVTYLQRYTLLAALGLATTDDDDDGRGGYQRQAKDSRQPIEKPQIRSETNDPSKISEAQRKRFYAISKSSGYSDEEIKEHLSSYGIEHTADISKDKYDALCAWASERHPGQEG